MKGRDERPKKKGALDSPPTLKGRGLSNFLLDTRVSGVGCDSVSRKSSAGEVISEAADSSASNDNCESSAGR